MDAPPIVRKPRKSYRLRERGAIRIIEEATRLLREAPLRVLTVYYVGSLPFALGLLYFWADMSRSALAEKYAAVASLGLAILFAWMKCWQALFARQLHYLIRGQTAARPTMRQLLRLAAIQTWLQAFGLVLLPLSAVLVLPLAWVYAFYQNLTALAHREEGGAWDLVRLAWKQAKLWPLANHYLLAILSLFSLFVFLNLGAAIYVAPGLLKSLLGLESLMAMSGWALVNTTFWIVTASLTYLCLDPLLKTVYVLRCYYGASLSSGEDIRVELAASRRIAGRLALVVLGVLLTLGTVTPALAADGPQAERGLPLSGNAVTGEELDRALKDVLERREFSWRLPRDKSVHKVDEQPGPLEGFFTWLDEKMREVFRTLGRWKRDFERWLRSLRPESGGHTTRGRSSGESWFKSLNFIIYTAAAILAFILAVVLYRAWRRRTQAVIQAAPAVLSQAPDLEDESVGADDLPVDEWTVLARDLARNGDYRLALRALYLGTLARMAEQHLISIAKYKSNRDYTRELMKRERARGEILDTFTGNVAFFDRVWYGRGQVGPEEYQRFEADQLRVRSQVDLEFGALGREAV